MEATANVTDRILVPLDGSLLAEQALPYAQAIGGPAAELILLAVVPWAEEARGLTGKLLATADEVQAADEAAAREGLERARRAWLGERSNVRLEVAAGDPAEQILWAATERGVDLIVLASHGRGALGRWAFGSVADRVARLSRVPVLVVRPVATPAEPGAVDLGRLVVPLDGSELAARALPTATALARRLDVPVHVVRVIDPSRVLGPPSPIDAAIPGSVYEEAYEAQRAEAARTVGEAVARLEAAGVAASSDVLTGLAAPSLLGIMQPGDLVVLTSHGRGGVRRWLLGSVAEKLVREGSGPVVLVPAPERAAVEEAGRRRHAPPGELLRKSEYRPEELADLLGMDVNLVREEAFAGRLRAEIVGHHIVHIRREDALRWLAERE